MERIVIHYLVVNVPAKLPVLIVLLVGLILAMVFWGRSPRRAGFALAGLGLMLLWTVASLGVFAFMPVVLNEVQVHPRMWSGIYLGAGCCDSLIWAGGFGLLLPALFGGPTARASAPREDDEED